MRRGILRVYLGSATGVGKTFAMLEEGRRLASSGSDVVIGVVETHDRVDAIRCAEGLPVLRRKTVDDLADCPGEFDLEALLERKPSWAIIDELAHTNAPGSTHEKRWQDVHAILDCGINVLTTVNIQHLESLTDVVRSITGVEQIETIPDSVLRNADQIELVDVSPEQLRERLAAGHIHEARAVNAELANYFRPGNLTALRELALLWLADEVDASLRDYQSAHNIRATWEARERIVVALSGGPEGEILIRRAARIAARSGRGMLWAVHAFAKDGLVEADRDNLITQREMVESFGGTYHRIPSDRIADDLVEFARSHNATQLVIGDTPHGRLHTFVRGPGIGHAIIRASGDIDVHTVTLAARPGTRTIPARLHATLRGRQ